MFADAFNFCTQGTIAEARQIANTAKTTVMEYCYFNDRFHLFSLNSVAKFSPLSGSLDFSFFTGLGR